MVDVPANRLGEFLRAHRDSAQPGVQEPSRRRRTPGLRREEVAARATISTDYYTRLEQGRERHPSGQVLDALAVALELSSAETRYLHELVAPAGTPRTRRTGAAAVPNEFLLEVMDSWTLGPAYVINHRTDVLARNQQARDFAELFEISDNILRMVFLDPTAQRIWLNWEVFTSFFVGGIRRMIGPLIDDDPSVAALIAELRAGSDAFALLWDSHQIGEHDHMEKNIRRSERDEVRLDFKLLMAIDDPGQFVVLHRAAES